METEISAPHHIARDEILKVLEVSSDGLIEEEVKNRLETFGPNVFPVTNLPGILVIFFRQFLSPLIYVLLAASILSVFLGDITDAIFIFVVLFLNAIIGTIQEYSAEKSAEALRHMSASNATVLRDGHKKQVPSENLVPGDIVFLESGTKVPADLRLINSHSLEIDESLLTGESLAVPKDDCTIFDPAATLGDRLNMAFTGSLVINGRGEGVVTSTGLKTELGLIARDLNFEQSAKPPLLIRMEGLTRKISLTLLLVSLIIASYLVWKGHAYSDVFLFVVALAVAAIPEGLPVALTVALSIAARKMAKRNVIVRRLPAVEALGSCTFIATDKTGTLTVNQLTIKKIFLGRGLLSHVSGSGHEIEGDFSDLAKNDPDLQSLLISSVLCNEAHQEEKSFFGDAVDIAFLVLTHKANLDPEAIRENYELVQEVPYEPINKYAATLHQRFDEGLISVKGALEVLLPWCKKVDQVRIIDQGEKMAKSGLRVLAVARKKVKDCLIPLQEQLYDLEFVGIVGMIDPLRPEALEAVKHCRSAGIEVAMVTGDHPETALAIATELGLTYERKKVVSGVELKAAWPEMKDELIQSSRVFARVEPRQKLEIVNALIKNGDFVAVTGDGANDAPALKAANVGIAMGKSGTDLSKETADLILTDDRFASIVSGVEEGRIAYSNIRKVVYLLISTGIAEILLFVLSMIFETPMPLTAVQLLWLNLVTNGIQDVALTFEPGEGDELEKPPRRPDEAIIDRCMLERVLVSALVVGGVTFWQFQVMLNSGIELDQARNLTLLLLVLFENMLVGNSRSESKSVFTMSPLRNPFLLIGTIGAQLLHVTALYIPGLNRILGVGPVTFMQWFYFLAIALTVLVVVEAYKWIRRIFPLKVNRGDRFPHTVVNDLKDFSNDYPSAP